jgi:xanthine dehydrogenase YagR molybdenum-binding subunit
MANTWPKQRRLLGTKVQRLDGPDKATGRAKYSYDINRPGMLHASTLRCPFAHAKLVALDYAAASKMPGVRAVFVFPNVEPGKKEFIFAGDEILAIAADTEEQARDAVRAVKVEYEVQDFLVREEDALQDTNRKTLPDNQGPNNLLVQAQQNKGNVDQAFRDADAVVEGEYGVGVVCHQCLEAHGLVAEWEKPDQLTVWCSTQATTGVSGQMAGRLRQMFRDTPNIQVKCITHYMGGGFGSKFGPDEWGFAAAALARQAGKPVKLMLERADEITVAGNRPSAYAKVKIAGKKDGTITAYQAETWGTPGIGRAIGVNIPYVYTDIANVRTKNTVVRLNTGNQRAFRAPGHPQNCILTDTAVDDLAAKLGIDPTQVRLKNLPANLPDAIQNSPQSWNALRNTIYTEEIKIAQEKSGWAQKWHPPGKGPEQGPIKHGIGMAIHTWGGAGRGNNDVTVRITSDGSVTVQSSTQDLGTGERTVLAIVAAEILGLEPKDIITHIGESQFGRSTGSGGSTTTPGTSPAALNASVAVRDALFDKIAGRLGSKKEDLAIEPGKVVDKAQNKSWPWKEACAKLGSESVKGDGDWTPGLSNVQVGGVQVAEVQVDTETGVIRCTQFVAVQDCGLIVNLQGCESQVAGGVIIGVNYALFEERIMDRHTGRQCNADMEFYKLGGLVDMPKIIVHMHDMPERGVIGIGEPPTISTAAAISNAIFNAIGVRVPFAPFTPERVLVALATKGGKV